MSHTPTKRTGRGLALALAVAALGALGAPSAVLADDVTGTASVTGDPLAFSAVDNPSVSTTLDGTNKTLTDTFDISVDDPRGTGAGWNTTITSTTFSTGGGTPRTLSNTAAAITGVNVVCDTGTCTDPTNAVAHPVTVPADTAPPAAVKFFNAAVDTGMGDFTLTPTLSVSIPANTYAGSYTSTMTLTAVSGP